MVNTPAYPFPVKDAQLYNGSHMAYMDVGEGPQTLLFIHGLANYGASWMLNIDSLKDHYRCIAIDLPGNGLSDNAKDEYTISYFAHCLIDFIGRLGLTNVCLVGHSMGGQIALRALANAPGCADKLILCAPAGFETFTEMDKMFYQGSIQYASMFSSDEFSLQETLRSSFYKFPKGADKMIEDLIALMRRQTSKEYRRMVDQCVNSMLNEPVFDQLKSINQPTLVMYGDMDALIPNRMLHPISTKDVGMKGVKQMPNASLHMIAGCGHFLQWEKAGLVNDKILEWIK